MTAAVELLAAQWPAPSNVFAATTSRRGGYSSGPYAELNLGNHVGDEPERVRRNRTRLAESLGFPAHFQWLRQVHGSKPAVVSSPAFTPAPAPEADSLVTRTPGIALCVLTADCLPVFLSSRSGDEIAIIHAGWRGLSAGIIENTLAAMKTTPGELLAWLGPAILPCHYETGADLRQAFLAGAANQQEKQQIATAFTPLPKPGKYHTDLTRIAQLKLQNLGVPSITGGTHCTYCDPELFSHRREGQCGRMANLICIKTTFKTP